jgi:hypothetical protein
MWERSVSGEGQGANRRGGGESQQGGEEMWHERGRIEELALMRATGGQPGEQRMCGRVVGHGKST